MSMELIPAIDLMDGRVVRLRRGDPNQATVYSHDPVAVARHWELLGADAIHVVDLDGALETNRGAQTSLIAQIVKAVHIPVQVGGGIRTTQRVNEILSTGAHKAIVGTMALQNQRELEAALQRFGVERIMVALDYADGRVKVKGWQRATELEPIEALQHLCRRGVRQFLMTAIAQDGTLAGADVETLAAAVRVADAEVYASGGIRGPSDVQRLKQIGVKGIIVGKALYEGVVTMKQLCQWRMTD